MNKQLFTMVHALCNIKLYIHKNKHHRMNYLLTPILAGKTLIIIISKMSVPLYAIRYLLIECAFKHADYWSIKDRITSLLFLQLKTWWYVKLPIRIFTDLTVGYVAYLLRNYIQGSGLFFKLVRALSPFSAVSYSEAMFQKYFLPDFDYVNQRCRASLVRELSCNGPFWIRVLLWTMTNNHIESLIGSGLVTKQVAIYLLNRQIPINSTAFNAMCNSVNKSNLSLSGNSPVGGYLDTIIELQRSNTD